MKNIIYGEVIFLLKHLMMIYNIEMSISENVIIKLEG